MQHRPVRTSAGRLSRRAPNLSDAATLTAVRVALGDLKVWVSDDPGRKAP